MPKWIIQGLMTNLKSWIEIEGNSLFGSSYIQYYNMLKKQFNNL